MARPFWAVMVIRDFREAFREAVRADALARHSVEDERTRMVSTAILLGVVKVNDSAVASGKRF